MIALHPLLAWLPDFPGLDGVFSTQGIMVLLLAAYAVAMWMFLTSAPKVYTMMVSDLEQAKQLYEGILRLPIADVPLHYYYNYEQTLGTGGLDPMYLASNTGRLRGMNNPEGLWYQLKKNVQLHVISGASLGEKNQQRHICFDHECLEIVLMRVQTKGLRFKIRREKPLNFLVKDFDEQVFELAEAAK